MYIIQFILCTTYILILHLKFVLIIYFTEYLCEHINHAKLACNNFRQLMILSHLKIIKISTKSKICAVIAKNLILKFRKHDFKAIYS